MKHLCCALVLACSKIVLNDIMYLIGSCKPFNCLYYIKGFNDVSFRGWGYQNISIFLNFGYRLVYNAKGFKTFL